MAGWKLVATGLLNDLRIQDCAQSLKRLGLHGMTEHCWQGETRTLEQRYFIDGSIVKAHQHSSGVANCQETAIVSRLREIQPKPLWLLMLECLPFIRNGSVSMIPRKPNSPVGNQEMGLELNKYRRLVENALARLEYLETIATPYDKLKRNFESRIVVLWAFISIVSHVKRQQFPLN